MRHRQFEGWYFKQQCCGHTIVFIPARHRGQSGRETASLQIIFDDQAWNIAYPAEEFSVQKEPFKVRIGKCTFGIDGCQIDCNTQGISFCGELRYSSLTKPKYDIMGPFCFVPAMQCRHSLVSLAHRVDGSLCLGGIKLTFRNGQGYIEGDRGCSFPRQYVWTQCGWDGNCIMMSVADIPFCGRSFTGCISTVYLDGKEYRFATYLGARPHQVSEREISLRQGPYYLRARLEAANPLPLRAPKEGEMERTIRESLACRVCYELERDGVLLLSTQNDRASFEAEWV